MAVGSSFVDPRHLLRLVLEKRGDLRRLPLALWRTGSLFAITGALSSELAVAFLLRGKDDPTLGPRYMRRWCAAMTRLFDAHVEVTGALPGANGGAGALLICNHTTYMDIPVVGAQLPVVFVSMAELKGWPVIGWGGTLVGTIFVDRKDPESRKRVRGDVLERLRQGLSVLNYPEGRIWTGPGLGTFNPGLFRTVAGADLEIVPVTIRYAQPERAAWNEGATFLDHLLETAAGPQVRAKVHFGEPIPARDHSDPLELLEFVRGRMLSDLERLQQRPS